MKAICELTSKPFEISDAEQEYCRRFDIPLPKQHPFERIRNLLIFRNRPHLYNGNCAFSGEKIFSSYPPNAKRVIYDVGVWESDRWDAKSYGREYDFSRPFFEQFGDLLEVTPLPNLSVIRSSMHNSDYTNGISGAKNCYLLFAASENEDCLYSFCVNASKNILDCFDVEGSELCYDSLHLGKCYNVKHSEKCHNCSDSAFLYSCQSCKNCFGCVNLSNKEYHFFNEPLSKAEYEKQISSIDLGSWDNVSRLKKQFAEYRAQFPVRYLSGKLNESSNGDFISQTRNCENSYYLFDCEDVEWSFWVRKAKSCLFYATYGNGSELIYNSVSCGDNAYNLKFCNDCWPNSKDLEYCFYTGYGANNCFGCVGMKRASYCILNRQYSKEDYETLIKQIKLHMRKTGEYGKFFPPGLSAFPYNRSDVATFLPATKDTVLPLGYKWMDEEPHGEPVESNTPDNIRDTHDDLIKAPLNCELTGRPFRVIRSELEFYRRMSIPLPRVTPLERLLALSAKGGLRPLQEARCLECQASLLTVYADHPAGVYCETCFQEQLA